MLLPAPYHLRESALGMPQPAAAFSPDGFPAGCVPCAANDRPKARRYRLWPAGADVAFERLRCAEGALRLGRNGVAPDIEVELDPKAVREGRDPQLEKAVEVVLSELEKNPIPTHRKPAYPNYHQGATVATASPTTASPIN